MEGNYSILGDLVLDLLKQVRDKLENNEREDAMPLLQQAYFIHGYGNYTPKTESEINDAVFELIGMYSELH
jgi:hypothetical protein